MEGTFGTATMFRAHSSKFQLIFLNYLESRYNIITFKYKRQI